MLNKFAAKLIFGTKYTAKSEYVYAVMVFGFQIVHNYTFNPGL